MCRDKGRVGAREKGGPECINVVRREMYRFRSAESIFRVLKDKKDLKKRLGKKIIFVVGGKPGECIYSVAK